MFSDAFKRQNLLIGILLFFVLSLNGCIYVVVGSVGALGGYIISPDTVEGVMENSKQSEVWKAALEIIAVKGLIEEKNEAAGIILAKIQGTKVTVNIYTLSPSTVKVTVKARKAFLPKIKVAQDVYVKIVNYLEE